MVEEAIIMPDEDAGVDVVAIIMPVDVVEDIPITLDDIIVILLVDSSSSHIPNSGSQFPGAQ